jgi:hypothetical protein
MDGKDKKSSGMRTENEKKSIQKLTREGQRKELGKRRAQVMREMQMVRV